MVMVRRRIPHHLFKASASHFTDWATTIHSQIAHEWTSQMAYPYHSLESVTNYSPCCVHSADLEKLDIEFDLELPMLYTVAQYDISGRILLIPIKGNGPLYGNWSKFSSLISTTFCNKRCQCNWING
jgi:hypothetical protein